MRRDYRLSILPILFSFLAITFLGFQSLRFAEAKTSFTELPPMSLTMVGANGTQVVLNETDIAGLPSYRGYGGFKNQLGNVKGLGNYTGVSLTTLCGLVGGVTNTSIVKVTASDSYSSNFTFDEVVNGNFTTYNSSGEEMPHSQPLTPIAAYYFNDVNISESNGGPLRLAIVGPEGLVTNSTYWVKWVVRVEVIEEAIPEFPSPMVLPLLLFATSVIAFSFKTFRRGHLSGKRFCGLTGECGQ
jgi:DMSO/TMAO reductase YedYZ molybdopterin-dependent catalytic subunit